MGLVLALGALLAFVLVVHKLAARRDADRQRRDLVLRGTSPTFRVVALGVAGSGKTVFLAGMFHRLHVQSPDGSYFLETSAEQRIALSQVFKLVTTPGDPWPRGTQVGEAREFSFDCMAFDGLNKHKMLTINYLDYAGELLESQQEAGSEALTDLEARIKDAHALLGMIDGHRVLQLLRDEPQGHAYFRSAVQPMIGLMAGASCPIHFVLTKWDVVRDFGEPENADEETRLGLVRDALLKHMQLGPLVSRHGRAQRIVRLIPVSAVGADFARVDERGRMVKRSDGALRPTNLEAPLSAVLPDLFRQVEASLDDSLREEIDARVQSQIRLSPADYGALLARLVSTPAAFLLRGTLQFGVGARYGDEVTAMFLDWMGRSFDDKAASAVEVRTDAERQAMVIRRLRGDLLREFETTVLRLEARLPASRLGGS